MGRGRVEIEGALALVTGAGSGIGRATAIALAGQGAAILCADIDAGAADVTTKECEERGARASGYAIDVSDHEAMTALAAAISDHHGGAPDIVVNNAGVGMSGGLADITVDDWRWIRGVNLDGVVNGCLVFGPPMLERGSGQIVNVASGLAYIHTATEPAYGATKAAVLALSQSMRADWRRRRVGVSAICPGVINTAIIDTTRFRGEQAEDRARARVTGLFRRGHKPEKVAKAIVGAIARDRAVVPVGVEAWLGWAMHRFAPLRVQAALLRLPRP